MSEGAAMIEVGNEPQRKFTERGFEDFCEFVDTNGSRIVVRQSSSAGVDAVWIFASDNPHMEHPSPHLNFEQAKIVADALLAFVLRYDLEAKP